MSSAIILRASCFITLLQTATLAIPPPLSTSNSAVFFEGVIPGWIRFHESNQIKSYIYTVPLKSLNLILRGTSYM